MNTRACKLLMAFALVAPALCPPAFSEALPAAQFQTEVSALVEGRAAGPATHAAAKYFGATIMARANKGNVSKYLRSTVFALRRPVFRSTNRASIAANVLLRTLLTSYFSHGKRFDLRDKSFNKALTLILKALPPTARTAVTVQRLRETITAIALRRGVSQAEIEAYLDSLVFLPPSPCGCTF